MPNDSETESKKSAIYKDHNLKNFNIEMVPVKHCTNTIENSQNQVNEAMLLDNVSASEQPVIVIDGVLSRPPISVHSIVALQNVGDVLPNTSYGETTNKVVDIIDGGLSRPPKTFRSCVPLRTIDQPPNLVTDERPLNSIPSLMNDVALKVSVSSPKEATNDSNQQDIVNCLDIITDRELLRFPLQRVDVSTEPGPSTRSNSVTSDLPPHNVDVPPNICDGQRSINRYVHAVDRDLSPPKTTLCEHTTLTDANSSAASSPSPPLQDCDIVSSKGIDINISEQDVDEETNLNEVLMRSSNFLHQPVIDNPSKTNKSSM